jgi:TRAP-type mannitol/chloroaromatic compound transport system permease large subunit
MYAGALVPGLLLVGLYLLFIAVVALVKPAWVPALSAELKRQGREPDPDVLQALYVLQTRKGVGQRTDADWMFIYSSLERSFGPPHT